jgi:hypothetical protein
MKQRQLHNRPGAFKQAHRAGLQIYMSQDLDTQTDIQPNALVGRIADHGHLHLPGKIEEDPDKYGAQTASLVLW